MLLLSIFLVLSAVPLVSMPPLLTCHIGQRVHTSANNINICEDCPSGTFMNLNSHSLTQCFSCSECPAGRFIGRECNLTCNTVCCPMADMTVIDTEAGQFCAISADEYLENCTATCDNNTRQISNSGGVKNRSETGGVSKADTDYVRPCGYFLAIATIAVFILVFKSRHTRTRRELVFVTVMMIILVVVCPIFFVLESVSDRLFITCMIFIDIYCIYTFRRQLHSCLNSYMRNVASILGKQQNAPNTFPQDDDDVPECQQSDPLINDSSNRRSQQRPSCQDAFSSSIDESLDNDSLSYTPGDIASITSSSLTDGPAPGDIVSITSSSLTDGPAPGDIVSITSSSLTDEPEPGDIANNNEYISVSAEVGDKPHDTVIHSKASGSRPASHSIVAPESINEASGSGDCWSDKAGESGHTPGAGAGDGHIELSHHPLGLNFRIDDDDI